MSGTYTFMGKSCSVIHLESMEMMADIMIANIAKKKNEFER